MLCGDHLLSSSNTPHQALGGASGAEPACRTGDVGDMSSIPGLADPLEKGVATHSNILAWRIPWTKEPGELQSTGSQRVEYN